MNAQLSHDDPRLGLRPAEARADDPLTGVAMRLLGDALAGPGDGCICAPALGVPVRLLALRRGADLIHVLNPRLSSMSDLHLNQAETRPQTGPVQRHAWRTRRVTLVGTQPGGLPLSLDLDGPLAIAAQQAIEVLDNRDAFSWVTPFHRAWLRATDAPVRTRARAINHGLHRPDGAAMRLLDDRHVQVMDDDGAPLGVIDSLNPAMPVAGWARRCLGLLCATSALRHVMVMQPAHLPLAVAALALVPGLTVHHPATGWPTAAIQALDLGAAFRTAQLSDTNPDAPRLDGIVTGADADWLHGPDALARIRHAGRRLSGDGGVLLVHGAGPLPAIRDLLQAAFPAVHAVDDGDATFLVAAKARLDMGAAHARVQAIVNRTDQQLLLAAGCTGWQTVPRT